MDLNVSVASKMFEEAKLVKEIKDIVSTLNRQIGEAAAHHIEVLFDSVNVATAEDGLQRRQIIIKIAKLL